MVFTSRWQLLPLDILYQQIDYLEDIKDVINFCADPYIYEKICKDGNGFIWKNLFNKYLSNTIILNEKISVMARYAYDMGQLKEFELQNDYLPLLKFLGIKGYEQYLNKWLKESDFWNEDCCIDITPSLDSACEYGHLHYVKWMVENCNIDLESLNSGLEISAQFGHLSILQYLIKNGADIHTYADIALRIATKKGHLEMVEYLVNNGADVNTCQGECLRFSSGNGHLSVVKFLIKKGANVQELHNFALRCAVWDGHLDVVKHLIKKGANIRDVNPMSLIEAKENGYTNIVDYIESINPVLP